MLLKESLISLCISIEKYQIIQMKFTLKEFVVYEFSWMNKEENLS
jgi:hypothetical protein